MSMSGPTPSHAAMAPPSDKSVVLLSGGLDSTVSLAMLLHDNPQSVSLAITMDYGQRSRMAEIKSAQAIAAYYHVPHRLVSLPWLQELLPPAMAMHPGKVSWEQDEEESQREGQSAVQQVWVPNRNGVFLNIAAAYAEALGASYVVFGANAEEREAGFPDHSLEYQQRLSEAFAHSTLSQVRVRVPVGEFSKAELIQKAFDLSVPLRLIWSCYDAGEAHCGRCPSCLLLKSALERENVQNEVSFIVPS